MVACFGSWFRKRRPIDPDEVWIRRYRRVVSERPSPESSAYVEETRAWTQTVRRLFEESLVEVLVRIERWWKRPVGFERTDWSAWFATCTRMLAHVPRVADAHEALSRAKRLGTFGRSSSPPSVLAWTYGHLSQLRDDLPHMVDGGSVRWECALAESVCLLRLFPNAS